VAGDTGAIHTDLVIAADGRNSSAREDAGLVPREYGCPFDAWWFRISRQDGDQGYTMTPFMKDRRFAMALPRTDYYQVAYLTPKDQDLRTDGIEAFRANVARVCPQFADRVGELESMADVEFLEVRMNRLDRWHVDGLLCIGDAAHAMSPAGGCGINLAVQDAVAAASLLAGPLLRGRPSPSDLAKVRARRLRPTKVLQRLQKLQHRVIIGPVLAGRRNGPPLPMAKLFGWFPVLPRVVGRLLAVGVRPEHVPGFARRATEPVQA
jgi:2-polyprenyl-6-methoxyphenol hydroxylase-like FAD-dependent oxidoreductase